MRGIAPLGRRLRLWPRTVRLWPRTVRLRLTLVYGAVVLVSGAVLVSLAFLLGARPTNFQVSGEQRKGTITPVLPRGTATGPTRGGVVEHVHGGAGSITFVVYNAKVKGGGITVNEIRDIAGYGSSSAVHELLFWSGVALVIVTVLGLLLGWAMSGRVLRPLRAMTLTTQQISEDNLHERLAIAGPTGDELKELGDTIDGLLGRLESAFAAQGRFVQNASHELRTPLAMMRTSLDVATGKPSGVSADVSRLAGKLRQGLDQADRLLESLLVLARVQQTHALPDTGPVVLADAVAAAVASQREAGALLGLEVRVDADDTAVRGSAVLLSRLVANLVDNAVRHNEPGGFVAVTLRGTGTGARLVIENGGPLFDQARVDRLGEPFERPGAERTAPENGVGLGLSIVKAITEAHGGTVTLEARQEGGLCVTVELPFGPVAGAAGAWASRLSTAGEAVTAGAGAGM